MSATEKFEHYEVLKREDGSLFELGRGAMGITYKALDTDLQCLVALKIINPATIENADAEQRFFREARSAAQLRHPNIASVFRLGKTEDGTHYYAMEFCEGQTLQQMLEQNGPLDCHRALDFTLQVTKALIVAEEQKLVHRDLKPSNLIVTQRSDEGEVIKVIDFGLAKSTKSDNATWSSMGTHGFIGTAHFASPEQIEDGAVDTRSDIYSLGSTLWFMLLGKPPFEGSLARIMSQHLTAEPDYAQLNGFPGKVVAMVRRMMAKDADQRQQSAQELRREIKECMDSLRAEPSRHGTEAIEPPPLPGGPSVEEGKPWTPYLLDLLRVRSMLPPAEAFRIAGVLAAQLDQLPEGAPLSELRVQEVSIHFQDQPSTNELHARLRQQVTAWPPFDLVVTPIQTPAPRIEEDPSEMTTIVPGGDTVGDKVQQLAHLIYELLGGVPGTRYVPLASLGESGNALLHRATVVGLAGYPKLVELADKLRAATEEAPPHATNRPSHGTRSEAIKPSDSSPGKVAPPVSTPQPMVDTPPPTPEASSASASQPQREKPTRPASKTHTSSAKRKIMMALSGIVGVFAIVSGIKTIMSGMSPSQKQETASLPATASEVASSSTPQPDVLQPSASPQSLPPASVATGAANNSRQFSPDAATQSPSLTAPGGQPLVFPAGAPQFTIFDDLGEGQMSETITVFLDDNPAPIGTLSISTAEPHGSLTITLPSAGRHFLSAQTHSEVLDPNLGVKTINAAGRWQADFHGGEKLEISAVPNPKGDSYQLQILPRK